MLTPLESSVLEMLLDKPGEPYLTIRQQLAHGTVAKREFTGVGFFTDFVISAGAPVKRDLADITIGDVGAEIPGLESGAGFLLFVREGVVSMLEAYTYGETWPTNISKFRLFRIPA